MRLPRLHINLAAFELLCIAFILILIDIVLRLLAAQPYIPIESKLHAYQDLTAGVLALIGGLIGAWFLNRQIRQQAAHDRYVADRELAAERAVLPLSLSAISGYCQRCMDEVLPILDATVGGLAAKGMHLNTPPTPAETILQLRDFVRAAPPEVGDAAAKLLQGLQVQQARFVSMVQKLKLTQLFHHEAIEHVLDIAEVHARASSLFEYARGKGEGVKPGVSGVEILRSLNNMGWVAVTREYLIREVERRYGELPAISELGDRSEAKAALEGVGVRGLNTP